MARSRTSVSVLSTAAVTGMFLALLFGFVDDVWACKSAPQKEANESSWFDFSKMLGISVSSDICDWALDMTSSSSDISSSRHQQVAKSEQAIQFASHSMENLSQDMAQGSGEYLSTLAELLDVPADRQDAFFALAQDQYPLLAQEGASAPAKMIHSLQTAMAAHPAFAQTVALR